MHHRCECACGVHSYAFGHTKLYLLSTLDVIHVIKSTRALPSDFQWELKGHMFNCAHKEPGDEAILQLFTCLYLLFSTISNVIVLAPCQVSHFGRCISTHLQH